MNSRKSVFIVIFLIITFFVLSFFARQHALESSESAENKNEEHENNVSFGEKFKVLFTKKSKCKSNKNPVFTNHITDISKINNIVIPPNFVGEDLKTHSYIETDHVSVPVYAPIDMTLTTGSYYVSGPYRLDFKASCEVTVRFMHITEPIDSIKDIFPDEPGTDSRDQKIKKQIKFKAGDLIGYTTGTSVAGNWDFGVYNSSTKNKYAKDEKFNWSSIYTTAVCPYDYFSPELKSLYEEKYNLRENSGAEPDGESFCK